MLQEACVTARFSVKSGPDDTELGDPGGHAGEFPDPLQPLLPPQLCQLNVGAPRQPQKHRFAQVLSLHSWGKATQWKTQTAGTLGKVGWARDGREHRGTSHGL